MLHLEITHAGRRLDLTDPLFIRLLNCVTPADHETFAERYGVLGDRVGSEPRDSELFAGRMREMAEFLFATRQGSPTSPGLSTFVADKVLEGVHLEPRLAASREGKGLRFVLEAPDLAAFLAMELAAATEAGSGGRRCDHCHRLFLLGPMTDRRSDAKYCADRCRVGAMRVRNASRGGDQ